MSHLDPPLGSGASLLIFGFWTKHSLQTIENKITFISESCSRDILLYQHFLWVLLLTWTSLDGRHHPGSAITVVIRGPDSSGGLYYYLGHGWKEPQRQKSSSFLSTFFFF